MTFPDRDPSQARWCVALGETLSDVGRRVGRLSVLIAQDWPDERGREWAERLGLLHRRLGRDASAAVELGDRLVRQPERVDDGGLPPATGTVSNGARRPGMRLGDTGASRAQEGRGMRIAELPDPGEPPG